MITWIISQLLGIWELQSVSAALWCCLFELGLFFALYLKLCFACKRTWVRLLPCIALIPLAGSFFYAMMQNTGDWGGLIFVIALLYSVAILSVCALCWMVLGLSRLFERRGIRRRYLAVALAGWLAALSLLFGLLGDWQSNPLVPALEIYGIYFGTVLLSYLLGRVIWDHKKVAKE